MIRHQSPAARIDTGTSRSTLVNKEQTNLPGPGNYSNDKPFGQDAPTFSIRAKPQDHPSNSNPGPGAYDPSADVVRDSA